jgi:hypothetical protein
VTLTNVDNTIQGAGNIGDSGALTFVNGASGTLSANVKGGALDVGAGGGSFTNNGAVQALDGSAVNFHGPVTNNSGGTLTGGIWKAISTGDGATVALGGATVSTNAADIYLSGAGSTITAGPSGGQSIDTTLSANNGALRIQEGRQFTATANGGAFTNNGLIELASGSAVSSFGASASLANTSSGTIDGYGVIANRVANDGTINANIASATPLNIIGGVAGAGTVEASVSGATVSLAGATSASTAGKLVLAGGAALNLGGQDITIGQDYQNANFGSGNSFNGHANVTTGGGKILAAGAALALSGPDFNSVSQTLNVGNVRTGGTSSTTLTESNPGTETILRGAVQNNGNASVALTNTDFVLNPNSANANTTTISYATSATAKAGSLAGQTLQVVTNFDNVAAETINLAGNVYQTAQAAAQPTALSLGATRVGGSALTGSLTVANVAPYTANYTEALSSTLSTASPFTVGGGASVTTGNLSADPSSAAHSQSVAVGLGAGTAGAFSGSVAIANTSIAVAGSGFSNLDLGGQQVNVTGDVYQTAVAETPTSVNVGVFHADSGVGSASVTVANTATGALTDSIVGAFGSPTPASPFGASGPLTGVAAGHSSNALQATFNTAGRAAGSYSSSVGLSLASHDSELSDVALSVGPVSLTAQVNNYAVAGFGKTSGDGALSAAPGTANYVLDFGTVQQGSADLGSMLFAANLASGIYSDLLSGDFSIVSGGGDFGLTGFGPFAGLAAGAQFGPLGVTFDTASLGTFVETIDLNGTGSYDGASYSPYAVDAVLTIEGTVTSAGAVPEPSTWATMGLGFLGLAFAGYRARKSAATAV